MTDTSSATRSRPVLAISGSEGSGRNGGTSDVPTGVFDGHRYGPNSGLSVRFEAKASKNSSVLLPPLVTEPRRTAPIELDVAVSVCASVPLILSWSEPPACQVTSMTLAALFVTFVHVAFAVFPTWIWTCGWAPFRRYRTWKHLGPEAAVRGGREDVLAGRRVAVRPELEPGVIGWPAPGWPWSRSWYWT